MRLSQAGYLEKNIILPIAETCEWHSIDSVVPEQARSFS